MKEIYLIIFQGGDRNVINVVRTNEKFLKLYAKASRHNYETEDEAVKVAIKLATDNHIRYIGKGYENMPVKPIKLYLD